MVQLGKTGSKSLPGLALQTVPAEIDQDTLLQLPQALGGHQ